MRRLGSGKLVLSLFCVFVCECVCEFMCMCTCNCLCLSMSVCLCLHMCVSYLYMCTYLYTFARVCQLIRVKRLCFSSYLGVGVCVGVGVCACVCLYVCAEVPLIADHTHALPVERGRISSHHTSEDHHITMYSFTLYRLMTSHHTEAQFQVITSCHISTSSHNINSPSQCHVTFIYTGSHITSYHIALHCT